MATKTARDRILEAALQAADRASWESVRLHDIAAELHMSLNDVRVHFREKEDITDAWFDRADAAMLQEAETPGLSSLPARERLHRLIMTWMSSLAGYRRVTREMIRGKCEPGHIHYQYAGLLRVSRTVQWLREAAHRDTLLPWRAVEESGLTAIYLVIFNFWMRDDSEESARTARLLDRLLRSAQDLARWIPGLTGRRRRANAHQPPHGGGVS